MKKLLYMFVVALVLFMGVPIVYGIGSMTVDVWRDILPYDWTHSTGSFSHGHGRHHHR
jgi:hypothetical protein